MKTSLRSKEMGKNKKRAIKPFFWQDFLTFLIITIIGALMHFTWEKVSGIGFLKWLAVFVPVNESNWEHAKMGTWPLLIWSLVLFAKGRGLKNLKEWLMPTALAVWSAYLVMFAVHSALPLAFGEMGYVRNIGSFMVGIAHGMMVFRIASASASMRKPWLLGAILLAGKLAMIILFTYFPPHIPLFMDLGAGRYGIIP
jgi:hypothetical protein